MQYKGAALEAAATLLIAPKVLGLDVEAIRGLDKGVASCYEAMQKSNGELHSIDILVRRRDVHDSRNDELMKFPNRLPVAILGYLPISDTTKLAELEKQQEKYVASVPNIDESEHDFIMNAIYGLRDSYAEVQSKKNLDTAIAAKGEQRLKAEIRRDYRKVAQDEIVQWLGPRSDPTYQTKVLSLYFEKVGAQRYNALARTMKNDKSFSQAAFREMVDLKLNGFDAFRYYQQGQFISIRNELPNLRGIFEEAYRKTRSSGGSLEDNLSKHPEFTRLIDAYPKNRLSELLDMRIIDKDMETFANVRAKRPFSASSAVFEQAYNPMIFVFADRNRYLQKIVGAFDEKNGPDDIKVSIKAELRCLSEKEAIERGIRLLSPESFPIQLDFETVADAVAIKHVMHNNLRNLKTVFEDTKRGYYLLAREYEVKPVESETKVLSDEGPQ